MIRLASPDIRDSDIVRCNEVLKSGNLVQGAVVEAFEQSLTAFAGFGECAVVSSGTAALHLALLGVGITAGDRVLVADFTFPATANVVENLGADCIFCDVHPESYVLTPEGVEACLASAVAGGVKAIIVVHEFGCPADIEAICKLAAAAGVCVIEDAACALGTIADGQHVGYYSDAACFSFHPRKAITTGEGGAVISRNSEMVEQVRRLRNHGMSRTDAGMDFTSAGLNYRMTDFQAALAVGQLERYSAELDRRRELVAIYRQLLEGENLMTLPSAINGHSWQSFMVVLDSGVQRDRVIADMHSREVETNLGAQALHRLDYFFRKYAVADGKLPNASRLYDRGLVLPLYGKLNEQRLEYIALSLREALHHA